MYIYIYIFLPIRQPPKNWTFSNASPQFLRSVHDQLDWPWEELAKKVEVRRLPVRSLRPYQRCLIYGFGDSWLFTSLLSVAINHLWLLIFPQKKMVTLNSGMVSTSLVCLGPQTQTLRLQTPEAGTQGQGAHEGCRSIVWVQKDAQSSGISRLQPDEA